MQFRGLLDDDKMFLALLLNRLNDISRFSFHHSERVRLEELYTPNMPYPDIWRCNHAPGYHLLIYLLCILSIGLIYNRKDRAGSLRGSQY